MLGILLNFYVFIQSVFGIEAILPRLTDKGKTLRGR